MLSQCNFRRATKIGFQNALKKANHFGPRQQDLPYFLLFGAAFASLHSAKTGFRRSLRLLTEFFNASLRSAKTRGINCFSTSATIADCIVPSSSSLRSCGGPLRGCSNPCRKNKQNCFFSIKIDFRGSNQ